MKKKLPQRIALMVLGVVILGVGVALLRIANFGTDPYSCMNIGVSSKIGLTFGTYQMLLNFVMLIPMIFIARKMINVGSFVCMFGVAYISDFIVWLTSSFLSTNEIGVVGQIIFMVFGIAVTCMGISGYVVADLGMVPYDAIGYIVEERTHGKLKFRYVRIVTDILCVIIGFSFGSTVGIATVITAFFAGPLVTFFNQKLFKPLLNPS